MVLLTQSSIIGGWSAIYNATFSNIFNCVEQQQPVGIVLQMVDLLYVKQAFPNSCVFVLFCQIHRVKLKQPFSGNPREERACCIKPAVLVSMSWSMNIESGWLEL